MSYSYYNDKILAYWWNRPVIAHEAFAQMAAFLQRLQAFSDLFTSLYVSNDRTMKWISLRQDLSNFEAEMISCMSEDGSYRNSDPNDVTFSMTSYAYRGFDILFSTVPNDSDVGCWLTISCGQEKDGLSGAPNQVHITISPELAAPDFLRGLLEQTVLFWHPADAVLDQSEISKLLAQPVGEANVGWLTYLADPNVAQALPDDFSGEAFADGILIQAAETPGKADDAVYMDRLMRLRDMLRSHSFLDMQRRVHRSM